MRDYDAINRRLRAERPDPPAAGSAEWRAARDAITGATIMQLEIVAAEIHSIWESRDYPGGDWLDVEGTQKLALAVTGYYNDPDDHAWPEAYVMIDGRLVYYVKFQLGRRDSSMPVPLPEIRFSSYREYIAEQSKTLTATDQITARHLLHARAILEAMR